MWNSRHSPAQKTLKQGYYWPYMRNDAMNFSRKCESANVHIYIATTIQELVTSHGPQPFAKRSIDFARPFSKATSNLRFIIMTVDYFTKWLEAKALKHH